MMDEMALLDATKYSDWHVHAKDPTRTVVFPGPAAVPPNLHEFVHALAQSIEAHPDSASHDRFVVDCHGLRFRVQVMGDSRYAARAMPRKVPDFKDLRFSADIEQEFMSEALSNTGGLVLVSGSTGSGKTTTISSVLASRLRKYGGYAISVEDPPEHPLDGFHGTGYCESMDASKKGYHMALVDALRCFPSGDSSMLLYGEVRESSAASELLRTGVDGHLVLSTIHSKDIVTALNRLISLAAKDGESEPYNLLANSLKIIAHQRVVQGPRGEPMRQMTLLKIDEKEVAMIRDKNLQGLVDRIKVQQNMRQKG